jgi:Glyoxalase/Bleomycin resistance protein/Dioxygenase superfamily.
MLRLVKKTVNFEDENTYHLYFSNQNVDNGTIITFFPREDDLYGEVGGGQVRTIGFSIPKYSFEYWLERLNLHQIKFSEGFFNNKRALIFKDPHNLSIVLVETELEIKDENILGFYGVELLSTKPTETVQFLIHKMGLLLNEITEEYYHLEMVGKEKHRILVNKTPNEKGRLGIGTLHHIAWSVPDEDHLVEWKENLEKDRKLLDIQNRKYFLATYMRDPGSIIYELATEGPGFLVDETREQLGQKLMLPEKYESKRDEIEESLPKLH